MLDSRLRGNDGRGGGRPHPLILKPVALFPLILNLLKDGKDGCYCLFGIPAYAGRTVEKGREW